MIICMNHNYHDNDINDLSDLDTSIHNLLLRVIFRLFPTNPRDAIKDYLILFKIFSVLDYNNFKVGIYAS